MVVFFIIFLFADELCAYSMQFKLLKRNVFSMIKCLSFSKICKDRNCKMKWEGNTMKCLFLVIFSLVLWNILCNDMVQRVQGVFLYVNFSIHFLHPLCHDTGYVGNTVVQKNIIWIYGEILENYPQFFIILSFALSNIATYVFGMKFTSLGHNLYVKFAVIDPISVPNPWDSFFLASLCL